ncbi:hypothetical protein ABPG74_011433 [Tetrahymena malaccensis]
MEFCEEQTQFELFNNISSSYKINMEEYLEKSHFNIQNTPKSIFTTEVEKNNSEIGSNERFIESDDQTVNGLTQNQQAWNLIASKITDEDE